MEIFILENVSVVQKNFHQERITRLSNLPQRDAYVSPVDRCFTQRSKPLPEGQQ